MLVFPSWCVHHGLQAIYIGGPGSLSYFPQCLLPPIMCLRFCVYMRVSPSSSACACNARRPRIFCPTHHNASSHRSIVCGYTHHEFLSELIWTSNLTYKMFGEALSRPFFPQRLRVPFAMQAMWPLPHHTKAVEANKSLTRLTTQWLRPEISHLRMNPHIGFVLCGTLI